MIFKVSSLDEASHTVSPCAGWLDEGSRNGNRLKPAVRMIPVTLSPLAMKARPGRRASTTPHQPITAAIGAALVHGYTWPFPSQPPGCMPTRFFPGLYSHLHPPPQTSH